MQDGALFNTIGTKVDTLDHQLGTLDHQLGTYIALRDQDREKEIKNQQQQQPEVRTDQLRMARLSHGLAETSKDLKLEVGSVMRAS